ncbi:MAG: T9SS type A sorting domain-containing protein [Candidatus Cloacimonetes bacterium]|nr:T9SS type A sorting domain-containing protein [Candidatus Cloacimonadota bacterium]
MSKNKIYPLLSAIMLVLGFSFLSAQDFAGGSGTESDPWQIETAEHLNNVRNYLGAEHSDKFFIQIADIDLGTPPWNEEEGWEPIGDSVTNSFQGSYNGSGHIIDGLYINSPQGEHLGLFGYTRLATIKNLGLPDVEITGYRYIGALAGVAHETIMNNCYSMGNIDADTVAGGLVGNSYWHSIISNSFSSVDIDGENTFIGCLVGSNSRAIISNCYSAGNVSGSNFVGGMVGSNGYLSQIIDSYSIGYVTGTGTSVGGLVGWRNQGSTSNSFWDIETSGQTTSQGGIGRTTAQMTYPYDGNTYVQWDFINIWDHDITGEFNNGYPLLRFYHESTTHFAGGTGTQANPWQIANAVQLNNVRYYLGEEHDNKHFILTADIDLGVSPWNYDEGWVPIGNSLANSFQGHFNGAGYSISGLTINRNDSDNQALFGCTLSASIANVTLEEVDISGFNKVGGLVGININYSTITQCSVAGVINGTGNNIGGLVGFNNNSLIENCSSTAVVSSTENYIGGLVGSNVYSIVDNSSSAGEVSGNSDVGGLVGLNYTSEVKNSFSTCNVSGSSNTGGLVGVNYISSSIENSYSTGNLIANGNQIGGLVGYNYDHSHIIDSYSNVFVQSSTGNRIGGLVGSNFIYGEIINCHSSGHVVGYQEVGGLVGYNSDYSSIEASHNSGVVVGTGNYIGGLVGFDMHYSSINDCYNTGDVIGSGNSTGGLVGSQSMNLLINYSYNTGSVTGYLNVGGLVGYSDYITINNCYNKGTIHGYNTIGGLIGFASLIQTDLINSYNTGNVSGEITVGGIVGRIRDRITIINCYSKGLVVGNITTGGLIGEGGSYWELDIINSYWDIETSGQMTSVGGEGRTTEEMTYPYADNTYVNWDFFDIWAPDKDFTVNNGYPYLREETLSNTEEPILSPVIGLLIYPNPFNPDTTIRFAYAGNLPLQLVIYNIMGQKIITTDNIEQDSQGYFFVWNGKDQNNRNVPSGVYFATVRAGNMIIETGKMLLLK